MINAKLKRCPFCGSSASMVSGKGYSCGTEYWIECNKIQCDARTQAFPEGAGKRPQASALNAWNNRKI